MAKYASKLKRIQTTCASQGAGQPSVAPAPTWHRRRLITSSARPAHVMITRMNFADRLKQLPSVSHLAGLQLLDANGQMLATIENKPGQAGSLAVYHGLAAKHGGAISPAAAAEGLEWYSEHLADAQAHPGKHPNIDRLLAWAAGNASYRVQAVLNPAS